MDVESRGILRRDDLLFDYMVKHFQYQLLHCHSLGSQAMWSVWPHDAKLYRNLSTENGTFGLESSWHKSSVRRTAVIESNPKNSHNFLSFLSVKIKFVWVFVNCLHRHLPDLKFVKITWPLNYVSLVCDPIGLFH